MSDPKYTLKDSEVIGHIEMLQGIIDRMAGNSANCKTWAITVVVAVLALSDTEVWQRFYICLGATFMFLLLDCYYLGRERYFIQLQKSFVNRFYPSSQKDVEINSKEIKPYIIPECSWWEKVKGTIGGLFSFSTFPLYIILALLPLVLVQVSENNPQNDTQAPTFLPTYNCTSSPYVLQPQSESTSVIQPTDSHQDHTDQQIKLSSKKTETR